MKTYAQQTPAFTLPLCLAPRGSGVVGVSNIATRGRQPCDTCCVHTQACTPFLPCEALTGKEGEAEGGQAHTAVTGTEGSGGRPIPELTLLLLGFAGFRLDVRRRPHSDVPGSPLALAAAVWCRSRVHNLSLIRAEQEREMLRWGRLPLRLPLPLSHHLLLHQTSDS